MSKVIQDLIESAEAAAVINNTVEHVQNIMQSTNWTADQVLDVMKVPADQRIIIKKRLEENK